MDTNLVLIVQEFVLGVVWVPGCFWIVALGLGERGEKGDFGGGFGFLAGLGRIWVCCRATILWLRMVLGAFLKPLYLEGFEVSGVKLDPDWFCRGEISNLGGVGVTDGTRTRNNQNHNLGLYH